MKRTGNADTPDEAEGKARSEECLANSKSVHRGGYETSLPPARFSVREEYPNQPNIEDTHLFSMLIPDDKDFICYLMQPDPRDRPSATEALMHPWYKGV